MPDEAKITPPDLKVVWSVSQQGGQTLVVATLTFTINGKVWHSTLAASAPTEKDAVAVIARKKVPDAIHYAFMQVIAPKLLAGTTPRIHKGEVSESPKASETPVAPAPGKSTLPADPVTPKPPTVTILPTSGPAKETPTPRARNRQRNSLILDGTKPE